MNRKRGSRFDFVGSSERQWLIVVFKATKRVNRESAVVYYRLSIDVDVPWLLWLWECLTTARGAE